MFQDLQDYTQENNIILQPDYILTDFKQAAICAVKQNSQIAKVDYVLFIWDKVYGEKFSRMVFLSSMVKTKNLVC